VADGVVAPPGGDLSVRFEGTFETFVFVLDANLLPKLVRWESPAHPDSGIQVAYSDYQASDGTLYAKTMTVSLPGAVRRGIEMKAKTVSLKSTFKDNDFRVRGRGILGFGK
ncbi:MAG: hypothetical protein ACRD96_04610, partial [Bryobacteraceae bacterium]